ncbi:MAG TPA: hypothetical protein VF079_02965 [Sphingomicrobium sp.]
MTAFLEFWFFYLIPFLLLFAMVRWYLFVPAALIALGLTAWLWRDVEHADGPGAMFAIIIVVVIAAGFLAGGLARGVLFLAGRRWKGPVPNAITGLVFLVGVPLSYGVWTKAKLSALKARNEPPSLACRSRLFDATMAGARLRIPLIPGIDVGEGAEFEPHYSFALPEYARRFCAHASDAIPQLTNLSLQVSRGVALDPQRRQKPMCDQERPEAWWPWLCRADRTKPPLIEQLHLFEADRYKASKMLAWDADRDAYFAKYVPNAHWVRSGRFQRLDSGLQTDFRAADWPGAATPYHANCFASGGDQYCRAGYRLTARLGIVYDFRTSTEAFERDARRADADARKLADSFLLAPNP